ncbi:MAG: cytochrome d ubiquinol oxidase subunit II [Chthoniobacteraceae bacterium]
MGSWRVTHLLLWVLMLSFPFPYIANSLGWMTAELGRQPWLIYGLLRTNAGYSKVVSPGDTIFTLIGFAGLYFVLGLLFLYLVGREIITGRKMSRRARGSGGALMIPLWYGILAFMLTIYVVLDGRNFGAGILHWIVARNSAERRQVIAAIGPLWSWHEVWLVGVGGVMLMAFPKLLAAAFSGYYLALILILWCILLRGISLEVGGHINDQLWQTFWDVVFVFSNVLLAVLFGAAMGNVVRGAPLGKDGSFFLSFFTNFQVHGQVGLLDWYTLSVAVFCVLVLLAHGATYLAMRTEGPVYERSIALARRLWVIVVPGFIIITWFTWMVRPELLQGLLIRPLAWGAMLVTVAAALALVTGLINGHERRALIGSSFLLFGVLLSGAATLYPVMLFSTLDPAANLTAAACASPEQSLRLAIGWWVVALILSFTYLVIIQRHYSGKVNVAKDNQGIY